MKRFFMALTVVMLVIGVAATTVAADPDREVRSAGGEWTWVNETFREKAHPQGNGLLAGTEAGTWTGTFAGESYDTFIGLVNTSGELHGTVWVKFDSVTVDGVEGGLWLRFKWYVNESYSFGGEWKILAGSGDLQHLRGEGEWQWYDDVGTEGGARYSGSIWEQ